MDSTGGGPRAKMVIEAIDALRARKARPDQERIVHWVHRRYGFTKEAVCKTIENSVRNGDVIRVKYKDSISYRNPAKLTRGSGSFNPIGISELTQMNAQHAGPGYSAANLVGKKSDGPSVSAAGRPAVAQVHQMTAAKRVLRVIRQIMLSRQSVNDGPSHGVNEGTPASTEQMSKGATTTANPVVGASIQDIQITLENQKQYGYDQELLRKLLERQTAQGAVRILPNGNYVLAGANTDKHLMLGKSKNASPGFKAKNQNRAAGSSLMAGNRQLQPPTLVKMAASSALANKRRFSDTSDTSSTKGKKGRKSVPATVTSVPQRARPVSQRKKFKKTLGPDFLEPSELGMPYLQNTFDPICDHCLKASKEDLLYCKDCEYKAHPTCLGYNEELTKRCRQSPWQCMYCKTCCVCEGLSDLMDKNPDLMLLCDMCDQGYHMDCHSPPITAKPSGSWACMACVKTRKSKSGSSSRDNRKPSRENDSDHGFEENDGASISSYDSGESSISEEVIAPKRKDNLDKIFMNLKPSMEEVVKVNSDLQKNPKDWTVDDVETFIKSIGFPEQAMLFKEQEVDGVSLLLLKRCDVVTDMSMKMGPALKIYGHIQRLQTVTPAASDENVTAAESAEVKCENGTGEVGETVVSNDQVVNVTKCIEDDTLKLSNGQTPLQLS